MGQVVIGLDYVTIGGWTPADGYVKEIGYVSGTTDWTYFESTSFVLPPMPSDAVATWFLFDFNNGAGTAWFDDVALYEIPTEVWVDDDYCDGCPNDGHTWDYDAFDKIQDGIDAVSDGDTILVAEGTYYENLYIQNLNNITLSGAGINRSIIDGGGIDRIIHAQRNYDLTITIEGFTIRNGASGWGAGIFLNTAGPCCSSSVNAIIRNCEVTNNNGSGIIIVNDWTGTSYIENNIISNNNWNGFEPYLGTYYLQHNTIVNNRDGYYDWSGHYANVIIRNNIIASNRRYGIFKHSTTPVSISYNDVWNNGEGAYYEGFAGPPTPFTPSPGTGEISEDPLFLGGGDYHLAFASPCIDAGTDVGVYVDMDGDVRPMGAGFDMGADEYGLEVVTVPLDIKPGSCPNPLNVRSKGVLPVAVLGTEDFDVMTIDPSTIELTIEGAEEGVSPLRWSYEDVATPFDGDPASDCHDLGGDGYLDLTLKIKTQELVETLGLDPFAGGTISLTITGNLKEEHGGAPIMGQDCVWVLGQEID